MVFRSSLLLSIALAVGCAARPAASDVITVAVLTSPNSLDPRVGSDETSQRVHQLVFDYLLSLDDKLRVTGGLATHFAQPNPLTYLVYLRKGVRFHDGHELTGRDRETDGVEGSNVLLAVTVDESDVLENQS